MKMCTNESVRDGSGYGQECGEPLSKNASYAVHCPNLGKVMM